MKLAPESTARSFNSDSQSCIAHVLAWKAADNDIDWLEVVRAHGVHVIEARHARPVLREHGTAERLSLDVPRDREAGPLEAEIEATDTGEQRADREGHAAPSSPSGAYSRRYAGS